MVSQTSEYALRAVVHLAQRGGGPAIAQEISEATQVPRGYLHKILRMLVKEELLVAQRGIGGGFSLARAPDEIRLTDILRATGETGRRIERCPLGIEGHTSLCALHALMDRAIEISERMFARYSIGDLLESASGSRPLCDPRVSEEGGPSPRESK